MTRTHHHGNRHGKPQPMSAHHRRAPGYEYWGRDTEIGSDSKKLSKTRRRRSKKIVSELRKDLEV